MQRGEIRSCGCLKEKQFHIEKQVFGNLTVIEPLNKKLDWKTKWRCKCSCGQLCEVSYGNLSSGHTKSCGCLKRVESRTCVKGTIVECLKAKLAKNNTSGVKGVYRCKGMWVAYITFRGKRHYLGTYDNLSEAALARKKAEDKYFFAVVKTIFDLMSSFVFPFVFSSERGRKNMDIRDEKCRVYEQLRLLMEERRELSKQYFDLKEYLIHLEDNQDTTSSDKAIHRDVEPMNLENEKELQDYFTQRKAIDNHHRSYKDYGFIIASILKESGKPLSAKQIYHEWTESYEIFPDYRNFVNNILPKINRDESIPVERAMRGYWQYRLKT